MSSSAEQLLEEVNAAISATLKSQEYGVAGRQQKRARLAELTKFREELQREVAEGANGGQMCSVGQICRPS